MLDLSNHIFDSGSVDCQLMDKKKSVGTLKVSIVPNILRIGNQKVIRKVDGNVDLVAASDNISESEMTEWSMDANTSDSETESISELSSNLKKKRSSKHFGSVGRSFGKKKRKSAKISASETIEEVDSTNIVLEKELKKKDEYIEILQSQLSDLESSTNILKQDKSELSDLLQTKTKKIKSLKKKKTALLAQIETSGTNNSNSEELQKKLDEQIKLVEEYKNNFDIMCDKLDDLETENEQIDEKYKGIIKSLEEEINDKSTDESEINSIKDKYEASLNVIKTKLIETTTEKSVLRRNLENEKLELQAIIEERDSSISQLQIEVDSVNQLMNENKAGKKSQSDLNLVNIKLEKENALLNENLQAKIEYANQVEMNLNKVVSEKEQIEANLASIASEKEQIEEMLRNATNESATANKKIQQLERELAESKTGSNQNDTNLDKLANLKNELSVLELSHDKQSILVQEYLQTIEEKESEIKKLKKRTKKKGKNVDTSEALKLKEVEIIALKDTIVKLKRKKKSNHRDSSPDSDVEQVLQSQAEEIEHWKQEYKKLSEGKQEKEFDDDSLLLEKTVMEVLKTSVAMNDEGIDSRIVKLGAWLSKEQFSEKFYKKLTNTFLKLSRKYKEDPEQSLFWFNQICFLNSKVGDWTHELFLDSLREYSDLSGSFEYSVSGSEGSLCEGSTYLNSELAYKYYKHVVRSLTYMLGNSLLYDIFLDDRKSSSSKLNELKRVLKANFDKIAESKNPPAIQKQLYKQIFYHLDSVLFNLVLEQQGLNLELGFHFKLQLSLVDDWKRGLDNKYLLPKGTSLPFCSEASIFLTVNDLSVFDDKTTRDSIFLLLTDNQINYLLSDSGKRASLETPIIDVTKWV
eukprot:TRINITY_DN2816_c0_g1_i1.p1 TRINITY_DN2816_c0_g1~~TRINITY_DN2816_c0_g1_i1.p1  ORF type:complete len:865 (-),score=237.89 TRINITY_DN2816_c0_g1_i1:24-2618(-)